MSIAVVIDRRAGLSAVKDQGSRPTCLVLATTLAHESTRASMDPLSPEYLHFHAESTPGGGAKVDRMSEALRDHGQPMESACPYRTTRPPEGWAPPDVPVFRRDSEERAAEADEVRRLVECGASPVLVITVPDPFFRPTAPWIVVSAGRLRGLHAVVAVGMGTLGPGRLILIRNSWGPSWGDRGHAWLDDAFLERHLTRVLLLTSEVSHA